MAEQQKDGSSLIIGFILGGIIGAGLALLFAPWKGRNLRGDLKRKAGGWIDEAGDIIEEASSKVSRTAKGVKKRAFKR